MVAKVLNSSTWEAEATRLWIYMTSLDHIVSLRPNQSNIVRSCLRPPPLKPTFYTV